MILQGQVQALEQRVQALELRLQRDSRTSSQPPSKDAPWKPQSERQKSDTPSGGQKGHQGKTLKMSSNVDQVIRLSLTGHCGCGHAWDTVKAESYRARQVHDLPEVRLLVTEYQAEVKVCPHCQGQQQADFPEDVPGQVQYGPRFHALALNLTVGHFLPLKRTCDVLEDLCGRRISEGTLVLGQKVASHNLANFEEHLKEALLGEKVLHADETGSKVSGKLNWIHVVSSKMLTFFAHHPNRGMEAVQDMDVLPKFTDVLMHDAWQTYFGLPARHALCNAHLLRELRAIFEHQGQEWAGKLREALQDIYHQRKTGSLSTVQKTLFRAQFTDLVEQGLSLNPGNPGTPGQKGRVKQSIARNLALRLREHQSAVLRFLEDDPLPFDNNQAERDIRMVVVKRKISGGFRSTEGGRVFCRIRSYISTLRKQELNVFEGLTSIFRGDPVLPRFSW
ncbi:IS66 family transposase [Deinococcus roseus]|uniref:IS66 family transposase n=1 Tax=Deinococcus roseus TaxID=392414 RepID=UPI001664D1DD|nr:IS66 family transposase [Deinococcus roseus]